RSRVADDYELPPRPHGPTKGGRLARRARDPGQTVARGQDRPGSAHGNEARTAPDNVEELALGTGETQGPGFAVRAHQKNAASADGDEESVSVGHAREPVALRQRIGPPPVGARRA